MFLFKIILTRSYEKRLSEIEDFIFESSGQNLLKVENFIIDHDTVLKFIQKNPHTPPTHILTGDQTWPFSNGQFRIFFKITGDCIFLLDIIDNRRLNSKIYPGNKIETFESEE